MQAAQRAMEELKVSVEHERDAVEDSFPEADTIRHLMVRKYLNTLLESVCKFPETEGKTTITIPNATVCDEVADFLRKKGYYVMFGHNGIMTVHVAPPTMSQ